MRALMRTVIPSVTISALLWRCRRLARRARVHRGRGYGLAAGTTVRSQPGPAVPVYSAPK